jgi:mRNA-degrading endonuclease RelE of RelBE toxin-antitoxin system
MAFSYTVLISATAERALGRIDPAVQSRLLLKIASLGEDPLQGKLLRGPLAGKRSLRLGKEVYRR